MSDCQEFKIYQELFPNSTLTFEQWKSDETTIRITQRIQQFLIDIIYESAIGCSDYPVFAAKVEAVLDWTVKQGLMSKEEKAEVESEF